MMALYDAFISYNHAKDKPIAAALQSVVQKLGKPWYRRRALRVFRDDTSLSATPHLWPTIERALGESRFLILLASPEAAASHWVGKEIACWLETKSTDTLLIAVTDGTLTWDNTTNDFAWRQNTPLPPALKGRFASEPKWVDLTAYRDGADKGDAKFTELAADFAAAVRGMPKEDLLSQEVRQQRRALTLAWSAAASLLILFGAATAAGVLAYRAQQEAVTQQNRAEQTLRAATHTANSLIFELAQRFRDAVGVPASLVKDILDRARALQEQLAASGQVTPDLQRSQASALIEIADTMMTIGDTPGAFDAADRARQIVVALLTTKPDNANWQKLGVSYERIGFALEAQGKSEEALKNYREFLAIMQRLVAIDGINSIWQHDLAMAQSDIGQVLAKEGKLDEALKAYRDNFAILEGLAASDRGNTRLQIDLSDSYNNIGIILGSQGKFDEALKYYRESLVIREGLAAADPNNTRWPRAIYLSLWWIAETENRQGKLDPALADFRRGLETMEHLLATDQNNNLWQRDVGKLYLNIGDVLIRQSKLDEGLAAYRDSLAIWERLAASDQSNAEWQYDLGISHDRVGKVLKDQGDFDAALKEYKAKRDIISRLVSVDPSNMDWQRDLAASYGQFALVYLRQGKIAEALIELKKGREIIARLVAIAPNNAGWAQDLKEFDLYISRLTPREQEAGKN